MSKSKGPLVLCILDGWGEWDEQKGNAIARAKLPTIEKLDQYYPKTRIQASGLAVGLPWGSYGNSEVGHQAMGTGQIIYQKLPVIDNSIEDGSFFENEVLQEAVDYSEENESNIHIVGLVSDGGVHSHIEHLYALLEAMKEKKAKKVFIHAITDGRDTAPKKAKDFMKALKSKIESLNLGEIATVAGRFYTMDRGENWDRVEKGYLAMTAGEGEKVEEPLQALDNQYKKGNTDEFIEPTVVTDDEGTPVAKIKEKDVVICFNFRKDRARQIIEAFSLKDFDSFEKAKLIKDLKVVCFVEYEEGLPVDIVFKQQKIEARVGEEIEKSGLSQLRVAETEKFAHVTYFFDGGVSFDFEKELKIHVPSKDVNSYADAPEMSAAEVTREITKAINKKHFDFILVNYANPDMVGHTGDLNAGIKAVEFTDKCLGQLIQEILKKDGRLIITADHGNVEEMINLNNGEKDTEHSSNPVPCWFVTKNNHHKKYEDYQKGEYQELEVEGFLSDIAPTVLEALDVKKPDSMTGESLLEIFKP
ncbi:MAG: 2,3-bisphosphoglycerate-independent phosphoglycerate mutase [Candidatus Moraniibacteriota bacterium]